MGVENSAQRALYIHADMVSSDALRSVKLMQTKRFVTYLYAALQRKKTNKLLARWERRWKRSVLFNRNMSGSSSQVSIGPKIYPRWRLKMAFNIFNNIVTLLREIRTHDKISSLLLDWRLDVFYVNLRNEKNSDDSNEENSDDSNDEDYVPIRPTKKKKKKNYKCGHCGVKNDHYITTCPKKKAIEERNANFVSAMSAAMGLDELD
jgi:Mor family transcriptional regulator